MELDALLKQTLENIKGMADVDNVIGKPIAGGDGTLILPVSKISYGFVVGGGEYGIGENQKPTASGYPHTGVSGGGLSVTPMGFLLLGREKKYVSLDKSSEGNKWTELLKAALNAMKTED